MELGSAGSNEIPLPLQDKNSFLHRDRTVSRRNICPVVKLGVVRLILLQNVVDAERLHAIISTHLYVLCSVPALPSKLYQI